MSRFPHVPLTSLLLFAVFIFQFILRKKFNNAKIVITRRERGDERRWWRRQLGWERERMMKQKHFCEKPFIVSSIIKWDFLLRSKAIRVRRIIFSPQSESSPWEPWCVFNQRSMSLYGLHVTGFQLSDEPKPRGNFLISSGAIKWCCKQVTQLRQRLHYLGISSNSMSG